MARYVLRRILETVVVLIAVAFLVFMLTSLTNTDPVISLMGEDITPEVYDWAYHHYGFDQPLLIQFFNWGKNFLTGNFGMSYFYHVPVAELIVDRIPVTLAFSTISFVVSTLIGVLLGVVTAVNRGKALDTALTATANVFSAMPNYWVGIMLVFVFAVQRRLLPMTGFDWPWSEGMTLIETLRQMVLPLVCLSISPIASTTRQTRSAMLEVIRQDYVRTARAKGTRENKVILSHALKNAMIPIMTIIGSKLAHLVAGSTFVEQVFLIPGMGTLMLGAVSRQDVPLLQAVVMFLALFSAIINLAVDILYGVVDPRIRLK